jgi:hypothetical protein
LIGWLIATGRYIRVGALLGALPLPWLHHRTASGSYLLYCLATCGCTGLVYWLGVSTRGYIRTLLGSLPLFFTVNTVNGV